MKIYDFHKSGIIIGGLLMSRKVPHDNYISQARFNTKILFPQPVGGGMLYDPRGNELVEAVIIS